MKAPSQLGPWLATGLVWAAAHGVWAKGMLGPSASDQEVLSCAMGLLGPGRSASPACLVPLAWGSVEDPSALSACQSETRLLIEIVACEKEPVLYLQEEGPTVIDLHNRLALTDAEADWEERTLRGKERPEDCLVVEVLEGELELGWAFSGYEESWSLGAGMAGTVPDQSQGWMRSDGARVRTRSCP